MSSKIYMCGMSGPNSYENLFELLQPIRPHVDRIIWVLHDSRGTDEEYYLTNAGARIIHYYYSGRHDQSRNQYLWCGGIEEGSWIISCDHLERISPFFIQNIRQVVTQLESKDINIVNYYNKPFIFQYHESLEYIGTPHESLIRKDGKARSFELSVAEPDESKIRLNVRPLKRKDPYHWVGHYFRYMMLPWGSNHAALGLENRLKPGEDLQTKFSERDSLRLEFRSLMRKRGFDTTLDGFIKMTTAGLDDELKYYFAREKVFQDAWRYFVKGDLTVNDNHHWNDMLDEVALEKMDKEILSKA